MNQSSFEKILSDSVVGVYRDETFHNVYPNFAPVIESIDTMSDDDLLALHNAAEDHILSWFPKFKDKSNGTIWVQAFCEAQHKDTPIGFTTTKNHKAIAVGICSRTRGEIAIRKKFKELADYKPEFYHKENWGKCVLFKYKGRTLMATSDEYFFHHPGSYSLNAAKPRFK